MNVSKKDQVLTLRVSRKLRSKLSKHAKKTDRTISQVIRKILTDKLKNIS